MTKTADFKKVKTVLTNLAKKNSKGMPKYQVEANINFFNAIISNVENGVIPCWIWPDVVTSFSKQNGKCLIDGPLAKLF
jgi:hypothetical protein